jgi:molecular chaperone IbpA
VGLRQKLILLLNEETNMKTLLPRTSLSYPFNDRLLGFESFFDYLDKMETAKTVTYPPYNIYRDSSDDRMILEFAVAGFTKEQIEVKITDDMLKVSGQIEQTDEPTSINYLHRGLSRRNFNLEFRISNKYQVNGARLDNGILTVELTKISEQDNTVTIQIK